MPDTPTTAAALAAPEPECPTAATSATTLAELWRLAGLPAGTLLQADLPGSGPVLPSSFNVATAAQASLAAAALAAVQVGQLRGAAAQQVSVDRTHATLECTGPLHIDGVVPPLWDAISGLYGCGADTATPGWVRIHANFAHHRDAALRTLGLAEGATTPRAAVQAALRGWTAQAFEGAATAAGGVVAAARSFAEWDNHAQALAQASQPALTWQRLGDAPPLPWPALPTGARPLAGLRVLDLTRILAGPVAGRCLAAYGAEVMLVNGPHLPNIAHLADTSRGKRSALIDLRTAVGQEALWHLAAGAQVLLQAYRPGSLAARGFSAEALAARRPGLVLATLSAYGHTGPWMGRRGFDSLVQTATGFNLAEARAHAQAMAGAGVPTGADADADADPHRASARSTTPRAMPLQILDYAAGHLLAFGIQAALWRQATQGGSWQVSLNLAGVGHWLRGLGRVPNGLAAVPPPAEPLMYDTPSGFGRLRVMRHAAVFSATPAGWDQLAMPPGSHAPQWP